MAINFDQDRSGLLGIDTGVNYDQMAFAPGSLKDSLIKNLYNIEQSSGFENPKLDELKKEDMQQFQEKGTPLSLPSDAYTAMAIANYDNLFTPKTFTDAFGVDRTVPGLDRPDINTAPFSVNEVLPNEGITKNVRFRDILLQDLKNLPSDIKTSLGTVKKGLAEDFSGLKNFATNLKDKGINLFGSGKEIAFKGIGSLLAGPVGSFIGGALANLKETPEQKAIKDFYAQNFGLTDTGQVASGIMQGYNPVYGFGGAGLQGAIDKRLATILKTEERKKKKGLELSQELINRRKELEALKERDRIAKANIAATPGFDVSGGAGGNYDRSFDYGANTREAQDRRSSDLGFSDIRLKENIELIGKSPSNINIYKFNYKDNPTTYQGVMAHEVPWANVKHSNGYMMVDYNKVDVKFKKWQR